MDTGRMRVLRSEPGFAQQGPERVLWVREVDAVSRRLHAWIDADEERAQPGRNDVLYRMCLDGRLACRAPARPSTVCVDGRVTGSAIRAGHGEDIMRRAITFADGTCPVYRPARRKPSCRGEVLHGCMSPRLLLVAALLMLVPAASAAGDGFSVFLDPGEEPTYAGPEGWLTLDEWTAGEHYAWHVNVSEDYVVGEFHVRGAIDVERVRQIVPMLHVADTDYPLFTWVPRVDLWDVDGPARLTNGTGEEGSYVIRVGIPGPAEGRLELVRDVTPPVFTVGEIEDLTHFKFYQETHTNELAYADLQIQRADGSRDVVQNPTPALHVFQRFPIQGLDADTEYTARVKFTDWAGNVAWSEPYTVKTPPRPMLPAPILTILSPQPNATMQPGEPIVIEATIEGNGTVAPSNIRLFLDKREVREDMVYVDGLFRYTPREPLAVGTHVIRIEVVDSDGGEAATQWTFTVRDPTMETPMLGPLGLAAALGFAVVCRARRD